MILIGDIGATKTLLAIGELRNGAWYGLGEDRYADNDHAHFADMLRHFLHERLPANAKVSDIEAACFGVAGPVSSGTAYLGNRGWTIAAASLAKDFRLPLPVLLNDVAAAAEGLPALQPADLVTLQKGSPAAAGPRAVISVGTGYNAAYLVQQGAAYQALGGEAGHVAFAPTTARELGLWQALTADFEGVAVEDVVSGRGMVNIHGYLQQKRGGAIAPGARLDAAGIAAAAEGGDEVAIETIELFIDIFGRVAGDQVLSLLPSGGLYLAGGVPPRLLAGEQGGRFMRAFKSKAKFSDLTGKIPVHIVLRDDLVLLGCARRAGAER